MQIENALLMILPKTSVPKEKKSKCKEEYFVKWVLK